MKTTYSLEAAEFAAKEVNIEPVGDTLTIGVDVARSGDDETKMYGGVGGRVTDRLNEVVSEDGLPYGIIPINKRSFIFG